MRTHPQNPVFPLQHDSFEHGISGVHEPTGRFVAFVGTDWALTLAKRIKNERNMRMNDGELEGVGRIAMRIVSGRRGGLTRPFGSTVLFFFTVPYRQRKN